MRNEKTQLQKKTDKSKQTCRDRAGYGYHTIHYDNNASNQNFYVIFFKAVG